jgi:hypothetical protein
MIQPDRITAAALIASIDEYNQAGCAVAHSRGLSALRRPFPNGTTPSAMMGKP